MSNKSPVSIYIVSGAEAHRIGRALESVSAWAAEIIVVLNEDARDGTEELCKKHGASVFREPWKGFIGQKNSAVSKTTQPWVLNLDADEIVPPELAREIQNAIAADPSPFSIYEFPRCTCFCGKWIRHGDWYPDRVIRLSLRTDTKWIGEEPHAALEVAKKVGRLNSDLKHFSNESIEKLIGKIATYQRGFVKRRVAEGAKPGFFSLAVRPSWRFMRAYFFRLGFLDGWRGFYIAQFSAFSTLTRQAMILEAQSAKNDAA